MKCHSDSPQLCEIVDIKQLFFLQAGSPKQKHDRHRNKERGRGRGRGQGRGRGELVMSSGIFSQGPFALNQSGTKHCIT